jgi:hypothetical protein
MAFFEDRLVKPEFLKHFFALREVSASPAAAVDGSGVVHAVRVGE